MKSRLTKLPPFLKKGSRIILVAPSGKISPQIVLEAAQALRNMGYEVEYGSHVTGSFHIFSGTDDERLADLQNAMDRDDVDAIWCVRGGYGAMRIVDRLNFDKFKKHPKWLIGFSDITVLHAAIQQLTGIATLHAPMMKHIVDFGTFNFDVEATLDILEGNIHTATFKAPLPSRTGKAEGILIGGNLSMLFAMRGTPYDIIPDGKILFIEDLSEYNYHIDRIMQNLRLSGILARLSGLIVGQFTGMKDGETPFGMEVRHIIASAVADYHYPVWFDFPAGHEDDNYPLILGTEVAMRVTGTNGYLHYHT